MHENSGKKDWGVALGLLAGLILGILALSDAPFVVTRELFSQKSDTAADPQVIIRHAHRTDLGPQALRGQQSPANQSFVQIPERVTDRREKSEQAATPRKEQLLVQAPPAPVVLSPVVPPPRDLPDEDPETLLKHARFLIKAGLAPIAKGPLERVVKDAPGTALAREAQQTLDSISRN
jgi:hypothetical protein